MDMRCPIGGFLMKGRLCVAWCCWVSCFAASSPSASDGGGGGKACVSNDVVGWYELNQLCTVSTDTTAG